MHYRSKHPPTETQGISGAQNAAPPEDVGGIAGCEYFSEILVDPTHEEYEQMTEWVGEDFDP